LRRTSGSTFLYLFERVDLQSLSAMLHQWILAQIEDQNCDLDQLIRDAKSLRGFARQPDGADGAARSVTQVMLYTRDLVVAIAQSPSETGDSP
jgi:hypothetical protein